ncbi:hypothetical protein NE237_026165 [Protea cynaroides]|uniref:Uncharacterized protein n=1 Tax=Protea cynaroides TaxID=273540 RepID=A0A9Q0H4H8_9MAGN|nr:hypothetical protein NE237_026165 [Protea cynaroides]
MDLSQAQWCLSLGLRTSHALPVAPRAVIADDSITLQIDSSFRDPSHSVPSIPSQLLEQQPENQDNDVGVDREKEEEVEQREEEEFSLLGHPLCLKRRRDLASSTSSLSHPKFRLNEKCE